VIGPWLCDLVLGVLSARLSAGSAIGLEQEYVLSAGVTVVLGLRLNAA
jgi:hypothetical protein